MNKERAFTLLELLVVIAIIGIITAIGMVSYSSAQERARDSRRKQDVDAIGKALEQYYAENNGSYPDLCSGGNSFMVTGSMPRDPQTGTAYCQDGLLNTTSYCVCALMEVNTAGNSNNACAFNATTHYCVRNQQ